MNDWVGWGRARGRVLTQRRRDTEMRWMSPGCGGVSRRAAEQQKDLGGFCWQDWVWELDVFLLRRGLA